MEGLAHGDLELVVGGEDEVLGADEAVEGAGGEAEEAEHVDGELKVVGGGAEADEAAHQEAEHGDLVLEAAGGGGGGAGEVGGEELAGVEAVFVGVFVAAGCAAAARRGGGGGHEGIIAQMFEIGKRGTHLSQGFHEIPGVFVWKKFNIDKED